MAKEFDNPFAQLNTNLREVPPEMRERVMKDVAIAKFILDMAVLVTSNYSDFFAGLFRTTRKRNSKE